MAKNDTHTKAEQIGEPVQSDVQSQAATDQDIEQVETVPASTSADTAPEIGMSPGNSDGAGTGVAGKSSADKDEDSETDQNDECAGPDVAPVRTSGDMGEVPESSNPRLSMNQGAKEENDQETSQQAGTANASVALQQKSPEITFRPHESLSTAELHKATVNARKVVYKRCDDTEAYISGVLVPFCQEVIERYKRQGLAAKDRPNGKPTVEAYFKSIDLSYSTVWSWIHRKKMRLAMLIKPTTVPSTGDKGRGSDKPKHLTDLEFKLLQGATSVHEALVDINHGHIDEAVTKIKEHLPTLDRIEEHLERGVKPSVLNPSGDAKPEHVERDREAKLPKADGVTVKPGYLCKFQGTDYEVVAVTDGDDHTATLIRQHDGKEIGPVPVSDLRYVSDPEEIAS